MKLAICAAIILGTLGVLSGADQDTTAADAKPPPEAVQKAYERLLTVSEFAFGGVGFAGTTSEGEKAFRTVLASTNALKLFELVMVKGSNEAKLYALTGIRQLSPMTFDAAAKPLLNANPVVTTVSGCIVRHEKAAAVAKRIASGMYDHWAGKAEITIRRR